MKILLIDSINPKIESESRLPHLGLGYLVSSIRKYFGESGYNFKIVNRNIDKVLRTLRPDIVFITSVTQNYCRAKKYAEMAKAAGIPVIVGGVHISSLPHSLTNDMDVGVIGEGEETMVKLIGSFSEREGFNRERLSTIKGIAYHQNGHIFLTEKGKLVEPLDSLTLPARELMEIGKRAHMFTSRGCINRCRFCFSSHFWGKIRYFSPEYVVNEIITLVKDYRVKMITFYDDLFIFDKERLKKISLLVKKEKSLNKVKFSCTATANLVTEEIVGYLRDMNMKAVNLGLESGCQRTLEYLKGKSFTVEDNHKAIRLFRANGFCVNASFVMGSPEETREEILETYRFIKNNPIDLVDTYILLPLPGTPLWDYAMNRDLVGQDMDWDKLNAERDLKNRVYVSESLNKKEFLSLYKKFQRLRFSRLIKNIWKHPLSVDIPRIIKHIIINRSLRI